MNSITLAESEERRGLTDLMYEYLTAAMTLRRECDHFVDGPDGHPECAWVRFERDVLHEVVNRERARRGLDPAPLEDVLYWERQANGHSDYARKFAFGCAQLAMGLEGR